MYFLVLWAQTVLDIYKHLSNFLTLVAFSFFLIMEQIKRNKLLIRKVSVLGKILLIRLWRFRASVGNKIDLFGKINKPFRHVLVYRLIGIREWNEIFEIKVIGSDVFWLLIIELITVFSISSHLNSRSFHISKKFYL